MDHWSRSTPCIIVGKRDAGKSVLARDLMYHGQRGSRGILFSGNENSDTKMYQNTNLIPYDKYQPHIVQELLDHQQELSDANEVLRDIAVVMDDCMYTTAWTHDVAIQNLFADKARNQKMRCIITMSDPMSIPHTLLKKVEYIFIFSEPDVACRRKLYEQYGGIMGSFNDFCRRMNECSGRDECLVIHNQSWSDRLLDKVFRYTAERH
jgi:hypothetical protein